MKTHYTRSSAQPVAMSWASASMRVISLPNKRLNKSGWRTACDLLHYHHTNPLVSYCTYSNFKDWRPFTIGYLMKVSWLWPRSLTENAADTNSRSHMKHHGNIKSSTRIQFKP